MSSLFKGVTVLALVAVAGYLGMKILDNKGMPASATLKEETGKFLETVKSHKEGYFKEDKIPGTTEQTGKKGHSPYLDEADKALTKSAKGIMPSLPITPLAEKDDHGAENSDSGSDARASEMAALYEKTASILQGIE